MFRKQFIAVLLPLLILLIGSGCATSAAPAVSVVNVRVAEVTADAMTFECELDLTNPNREAIELIAFNYDFDVDGQDAYAGQWSAEATLSPQSTKRLSIPTVVRYDAVGWSAAPAQIDYRLKGTLLYVAPGRLAETLLDTGVRKPKVHFRDSGQLGLAGP